MHIMPKHFTILGSFICASSATAATIYVDEGAAGGTNNGTSWADAFLDLQDGLKAAQPGDEVRIAQGIYKPAAPGGDRTISFQLPSGAVVQGGYAGLGAANPDELNPQSFITILSGDLNGDDGPLGSFENYAENSYNVMVADAVASGTQLRGVTITAGNADDFEGCLTGDFDHGGGLDITASQLHVIDVTFSANQAVCHGGALASDELSHPTVQGCTFTMNRMKFGRGGAGSGAAIGAWKGPLTIADCTFEQNGTAQAGGAIYSVSQTQIRSSRFIGNSAEDSGGALSGSNFSVVDCRFIDNDVNTWGGAAHVTESTFINCTFVGNVSGCFGAGAIHSSHHGGLNLIGCLFSDNYNTAVIILGETPAPSAIINSTFVGNGSFCSPSSGGLYASGPMTIANSIFWDNQGFADNLQGAQLSVSPGAISHTIIEGWDGTLGGSNNSGDDPQFVDADGPDNQYGTEDDDARLSAKSPAIDAGDNSFLPNDELDVDGDGNTAEQLPLDLDLEARIVNAIVDLGPYEFDGEPVGCAADVAPPQGNGTVDVDDLLVVINNWGEAGPGIEGDINNDQTVDVDDLLAVINAWGACR